MPQTVKKKRVSHKLKNKERVENLFGKIPQYSCYENNRRYCTTARNFIRNHNYKPPCIVTILKSNGFNQRFFYSRTGLFSYRYAFINHQQFIREIENINK